MPEEKRLRLFIQSVFPAPYRVAVFRELAALCDIFVAFERNTDSNRSSDWFVREFGFSGVIQGGAEARAVYAGEMRSLKRCDAVLAYDYASPPSARLMLRCMALGIPYFVNCDGAFITRAPVKRMIKSFFIRRAAGCFAGGSHAAAYFLAHGARPDRIFPHPFSSLRTGDLLDAPIGPPERAALRKRLGLPENSRIVLSVGQFARRKGFDLLLEAWRTIGQDALLVMIGGGEEEAAYKAYIEEYGLRTVRLEGFKPKETIFDYYKAADLFVLPTREDIWGLVINEAMACGLPVITTDRCVAGLELVEDGVNGYIVPAGAPGPLSERIRALLDDLSLAGRMGRKNIEKIREHTVENIAACHLRALEATLGGQG